MKKVIPAIILSFLLCLSLVGAVVCLSAKSTWLNKEFALDELGEQNYYNATYDAIISSCENIGIPSGIPVEVFSGTLSRDMVNRYIRNSIECLYTNTAFSVDSGALKESLQNAFRQYGREIKADIYSSEVKEALNELTDYCASKYSELVQFPFMTQLSPYISKAVKLVDTALILCVALSAVCIALLIAVCRKKTVTYIGMSLTGSGVICLIPSAVLLSGALYKNINLGTEVFYKFAVNFIESGLRIILYTSIAMIITGIIMNIFGIFIMSVTKKNIKKNTKKKI